MTGRQLRTRLFAFMLWTLYSGHSIGDNAPLHIAIDIGHSLANPGAISATGRAEFHYNRDAAETLADLLNRHPNLRASILNPAGDDIALSERTARAKAVNADLFISLHHDSVQPHYLQTWQYQGRTLHYCDRFAGYSLFVGQSSGPSAKLATRIGRELRQRGFTPTLHHAEPIKGENRTLLDATLGIYQFGELAVLRTATMPAVLIEMGVIVNREEALRANSPRNQPQFGEAIRDAILGGLSPGTDPD